MGYSRGKWGKKVLSACWRFHEANYPDLAKMVYDMYSILAMSAQCNMCLVVLSFLLLIVEHE